MEIGFPFQCDLFPWQGMYPAKTYPEEIKELEKGNWVKYIKYDHVCPDCGFLFSKIKEKVKE